MRTKKYITKSIDSGVDCCFGESAKHIFRGDLRIMASKRVRLVSVTIEIKEYADEQPTMSPQFLVIVDAKAQPDDRYWQKYAIPFVEKIRKKSKQKT